MQTTSHILMIRPVNFTFNAETAVNNAFQKAPDAIHAAAGDAGSTIAEDLAPGSADAQQASGPGAGDADAQRMALEEFNRFVTLLRDHGVDVTVIDDTPDPYTPDSIFPNNWISFHEK